ncbi:MAG: YceI family protein [Flavobacteriales bacterium]
MKNINHIIIALITSSICFGQQLSLDIITSELKWKGKEITTKEHYGFLVFKSGYLILNNNQPSSGKFIVDMTSLTNEDLPAEYRGRLEGHLKSDDFFSIEKFPEAYLEIKESNNKADNIFLVNGGLTIKGIEHPITFNMVKNNDHWEAKLVFDRSKYDVRFRSGTFFENLGDKLIYDDIIIETKLIFN